MAFHDIFISAETVKNSMQRKWPKLV